MSVYSDLSSVTRAGDFSLVGRLRFDSIRDLAGSLPHLVQLVSGPDLPASASGEAARAACAVRTVAGSSCHVMSCAAVGDRVDVAVLCLVDGGR